MIQVELKTANEIFVFTREPFLLGYTYFEKIHETKRAISKKFFLKIYELAKEYIAQGQIDKLGGYILDEDLQQAINRRSRFSIRKLKKFEKNINKSLSMKSMKSMKNRILK